MKIFRYLINQLWIGWVCLSYFDHAREWIDIVHHVPSFLNWTRFFFGKCTILSNGKHSDLCQYFLTSLKECYSNFICCPYDCDDFSSIPNSLAKPTATVYIDWNSPSAFSHVSLWHELSPQSSKSQTCPLCR